jgi:hypothetical protein
MDVFFYALFTIWFQPEYLMVITVRSKFYPVAGLADGRLQNLNIFAPNSTGVID